jgi:hypothetical protein
MRIKCVALGVALLWAAGAALAQDSTGSTTSLGDLARQNRAQRMKVMQEKSVRVWSNDNMPRRPAKEGLTAAGGMSTAPAATESATTPDSVAPPASESAASADAAPGAAATSSGEVRDEGYYRKQMSELRSRRELHQRQLSVLQQKLSQGQMQFYNDPNKALQQEYSRTDVNKLNDEIARKQQEIAADDQAIQDLEDQLRREGHPAGWLR